MVANFEEIWSTHSFTCLCHANIDEMDVTKIMGFQTLFDAIS